MAGVRVTPAQARRLLDQAEAHTGVKPAKPRRRPTPYRTVCGNCTEVFTTQAAEDRHLEQTGHCHYQLALDLA
jgi:hypothetical protein